MKLTIEVEFEDNNGVDMENKFNTAIKDFGDAIAKRGCIEMHLSGHEMVEGETKEFYDIKITS